MNNRILHSLKSLLGVIMSDWKGWVLTRIVEMLDIMICNMSSKLRT